VDPWDVTRDARKYAGPHPVVAHPPCERWGRYWGGGPSARVKRVMGDDDGCFASAIASVRRWGGVLEHPEGSHAFRAFGLIVPRWRDGWIRDPTGWVCCVAQGNYGHRARKLTWLYTSSPERQDDLDWSIPEPRDRLDYGFHSAEERRAKSGSVAPRIRSGRLSSVENAATPPAFRGVLIRLAQLSGTVARSVPFGSGTGS
jgi:hypothetical protein